MLQKAFSIVCLLAILLSQSIAIDLPQPDAVIAGVWCDSVPVPGGCPAPPVMGGGEFGPACAALPVNHANGGWPGQLLTALATDNCNNRFVLDLAFCGNQILTGNEECSQHHAWIPGF